MSRNPAYDAELAQLAVDFEACVGKTGLFYYTPLASVVESVKVLTKRMLETYEAKDTDYSENDLPMGNLREASELGIEPWRGVMLRIGDKKRRIGSFVKRASYLVKDEGVDDALVDLSNYCLLGLVLFTESVENLQVANTRLQQETVISEVKDAFRTMARSAITAKLLYHYRGTEGVDTWKGSAWTDTLQAYEIIARFSRSKSTL